MFSDADGRSTRTVESGDWEGPAADDEDSRSTDSDSLLCHIASVAKHSLLHADVRLQFPCFCSRPQQVGLLQQSPDLLALLTFSVSSQSKMPQQGSFST